MLEKMMENHKILIAIPIILALLSLFLIGFNGLEQGVDLKGGSLAELQLTGSVTPSELEQTLDANLNTNNIKVTNNGTDSINSFDLIQKLSKYMDVKKVYTNGNESKGKRCKGSSTI